MFRIPSLLPAIQHLFHSLPFGKKESNQVAPAPPPPPPPPTPPPPLKLTELK